MRRHLPPDPVIVAGYLAHRLPIERVIVLRCHPIALAERLRARPSSQRDLRENVQCEALDTIAGEARRGTRRTWELDTTHASPREVADRVRSLVRGSSERTDRVDWLDDPSVPPFLLRLSR